MERKLKLWRTLEEAFECFRRSVKSDSSVDRGSPFSLLVRRLRRYFHRPAVRPTDSVQVFDKAINLKATLGDGWRTCKLHRYQHEPSLLEMKSEILRTFFALCRISSTRSTVSTSIPVKSAWGDNVVLYFLSCKVYTYIILWFNFLLS